jgi:hypothetical protein
VRMMYARVVEGGPSALRAALNKANSKDEVKGALRQVCILKAA